MPEQRNESSAASWGDKATYAFARWCAQEHMVPEFDAPHGEAFLAGWQAGRNDGIDTTLEAVRSQAVGAEEPFDE